MHAVIVFIMFMILYCNPAYGLPTCFTHSE